MIIENVFAYVLSSSWFESPMSVNIRPNRCRSCLYLLVYLSVLRGQHGTMGSILAFGPSWPRLDCQRSQRFFRGKKIMTLLRLINGAGERIVAWKCWLKLISTYWLVASLYHKTNSEHWPQDDNTSSASIFGSKNCWIWWKMKWN